MKHLPKAHHVRQLLEAAAYTGSLPSRSQLDKLGVYDLPDGESLAGHRTAVNAAAKRIVSTRTTAGFAEAFKQSGNECGSIAQTMSEAQLEAVGDPDPESMEDITRRMFGR